METILVALLLSADPPLSDRERFPPKEAAKQAMEFNRAYRLHLQSRQCLELHRWWDYQEAITETDYLFHAWDWLNAAQGGEGRGEDYWRLSLSRLKELIGDEAYHAGIMPPNVPMWRFQYDR